MGSQDESEPNDRAALVISAAAEGLYDWDIANDDLWVSDRLNEMFGFAKGELRSRSWLERIHLDDRDAYGLRMGEYFRGVIPRLEAEYRLCDSSETYRWVSDRAQAIWSDEGRAVRLVGAIDDITARRETELALQQSEERYQLAVAATNEGIYDFDLDSDEVYFSPRLRALIQVSFEELQTGEQWLRRIHPDDLSQYRDAVAAHVRGDVELLDVEYRYLSGSGEWRWARQHGRAARHPDGRAYRMVGSTGDVTERVELEAALNSTRDQLQEAIESMSEGFVIFDADDRLLLCNSRYRDYFLAGAGEGVADLVSPGTSFEAIIRGAFNRGMFPDAGDDEEAWVDYRLSRRREVDEQKLELLQNTGMWLQINEHRTSDGGLVALYTDVTEIKQREADLRDANAQAEAATAAKSQFLANMSHELRTPLNAIIGITEMLAEDAHDDGLDDLFEPLERIGRAGSHLLHLINEILDLSKIEAGRMELIEEDVELGALLSDVAATAETLATANRNEFSIVSVDDLPLVRGDTTRVRQIMLNLLSNACKFTEDGSVEVRATVAEGTDGPEFRFAVSDSGIGISDEQVGRLFQDFAQADSSMSRRFGGTGLGLAISRRLARLMGGEITVESEVGEGSTFALQLPCRDRGTATPAARAAEPGALTGDGMTVLVIDDDATSRDLIRRVLAGEGFDVVSAASGDDGLERAKMLRPSLITLDVVMPGTDGWEVLRELKADPELADIPVLMLSIVDEPAKGFALGASDYLAKPVRRDDLRAVLARYTNTEGQTVMIVEDDEPTRDVMRASLVSLGWAVVEAANGIQGLERLREVTPDLILLDLMMPGMDGFEFLGELRSSPGGASVPVVVVTAADLSEAERTRLNGGVAAVLAKPTHDIAELPDGLREIVQNLRRGGRA